MNGREAVLGRIRAALGRKAAADDLAVSRVESHLRARPVGPQAKADWETLARFSARADSLSTTLDRVATLEQAPAAVARYLEVHQYPMEGVCWPEFAGLAWAEAGISVAARPATGDDLVGITGAFCGIADTGTLMFLGGPDTPAAASLLPETHVCLLPVARVVPFMEDAWRLVRASRSGLPRAVNFVSGPSRTADIEQTVTLGAHGPYRVHIVLVG